MMEITINGTLDEVVEELIKHSESGEKVYCMYEGHKLCSESISLDLAYFIVYGCSRMEQKRREYLKAYEERKRKAKEEATTKTPEWIARGRLLMPEELWEEWERIIPIRINDLYDGREVEDALVLMEAHKSGMAIEEIFDILDSQGHSGMSYGLIKSMIIHFYPYGKELMSELETVESKRYHL